jgi:hypothetical protein
VQEDEGQSQLPGGEDSDASADNESVAPMRRDGVQNLSDLFILARSETMATWFLGEVRRKRGLYWLYSVEPVKVLFFWRTFHSILQTSPVLPDVRYRGSSVHRAWSASSAARAPRLPVALLLPLQRPPGWSVRARSNTMTFSAGDEGEGQVYIVCVLIMFV